ncbi:MAG: hypothetical protein OK422_04800 [Thaumarchaeota archaeon]|nr:hypothetical protein [Nitrososphaerota archaeon]
MSEVRIPRSRLSLFAVAMLFILGLFTLLFVDGVTGLLIIALSVALYALLGWFTRKFGKGLTDTET